MWHQAETAPREVGGSRGVAGGVVGLSENSFTPFAFRSTFFKSDLLTSADWILDKGKESNSFFKMKPGQVPG